MSGESSATAVGAQATEPDHQPDAARWHPATLIGFRFIFCYLVLFSIDCAAILGLFVWGDLFKKFPQFIFTDYLWARVVPWVGAQVFHLHRIDASAGSDSTFEYLRVFCELVLAMAVTIVWSAVDRRRTNYRKLHAWLTWSVRLLLAGMMFSYGSIKVFPRQFGSLTLSRLAQRFGDLSRFDVLWAFMAASPAYTIFSGVLETLSGVLLLLPRLAGAGALLCIAVMGNVFTLNLAYDVPVKVLSGHLLLMAIYLAAPEFRLLFDFFVRRRPVAPLAVAKLSERPLARRTAMVCQSLLGIGLFLVFFASSGKSFVKNHSLHAPQPPLYGIWVVDNFSTQGAPAQSLFTDKLAHELELGPGDDRWQALIFDDAKTLIIQCGNGADDEADLQLDSRTNTAELSDSYDPEWKGKLTLQQVTPKTLRVEGQVNGVPLSASLHYVDAEKFRLTRIRFHWLRPASR